MQSLRTPGARFASGAGRMVRERADDVHRGHDASPTPMVVQASCRELGRSGSVTGVAAYGAKPTRTAVIVGPAGSLAITRCTHSLVFDEYSSVSVKSASEIGLISK